MLSRLLRPLGLCLAVALPALLLRITGVDTGPVTALLLFGAGVVAASFALTWAAEAAQADLSGGLAIALLALIAVLPEYAVDLYFAYAAGERPEFTSYAAANMTGSNRLLLGLGWPLVVLVSLALLRRRGRGVRALRLTPAFRVELGFLLVATLLVCLIPIAGEITLVLGCALLALYGCYLWRSARTATPDPELIGPAATIHRLPSRQRRLLLACLGGLAAATILGCAKPFADALIDTGTAAGLDRFLLVQWLAPLASEAPELIAAVLFATRGRGTQALGVLVASKINQWTLLVGSLPLAHVLGGGPTALPLDGRQVEEFLLTAAQTLLGVAALLALRFPRWAAWTLLGLFALQFAIPGQTGRYALIMVYAALACFALVRHRAYVRTTLGALLPQRGGVTTTDQEPAAVTSPDGHDADGDEDESLSLPLRN